MDPDKRQMRQLKRDIKRAGNKRRRNQLKRDLASNPDEAHHADPDLRGLSSQPYNGMDQDSTRHRK